LGVWDVEAGAPRWEPSLGRTLQGKQEQEDAFLVHETWDLPWTKGRLKNWNTVALHDLDTTAFRFRCWEGDAAFFRHRSDDGALGAVVSPKNWLVVHRSPFHVNWLLLTLCQALLALPLALLWAMLRLARRRRTV
jgi:hypothetical protein